MIGVLAVLLALDIITIMKSESRPWAIASIVAGVIGLVFPPFLILDFILTVIAYVVFFRSL